MRKVLTSLVLILLLLAVMPLATEQAATLFATRDTTQNTGPAVPVLMQTADSRGETAVVTLYFRYRQTAYLGQTVRRIQVPRDETVEQCIVRALLDGPDAGQLELTPVLHSGVTVRRVEREADTVSVVLSEQFLGRPTDAPADWQTFTYWQQEVPRRRRLVMQAITAALTESGRCAKVQFLVATAPEDTSGIRPNWGQIDPAAEDGTVLVPPQIRQEAVILTPGTAMSALLEAWQRKDWPTLYDFLTQEEGATLLASQTDFVSTMADADRSLLSYRATTGTVTPDGQSATVTMDARVMHKGGHTVQYTQLPVGMIRERGCWKLDVDTLNRLMQE